MKWLDGDPRPPTGRYVSIYRNAKIVFVGARIPNRVEFRRVCGVSRQKVHDALLWLKNNNYMYQNIPSKTYHNALMRATPNTF